MQTLSAQPNPHEIGTLLRGETAPIKVWTEQWQLNRLALYVGVIFLGAGLYGAAMGWWRSPEQGLYVAIKFPLIILFTAIGNALLNSMLAPLLGLNIPFRQSFMAILMSFTITSAILGAFSPLTAFMVWNAPAMTTSLKTSGAVYSFILLLHVCVIAFAGITANARLFQLLVKLGGSRKIAGRVLFAWLACNLLLGSQFSWIMRPFIGSPTLAVEFLRETAFQGNFFEAVFRSALRLLSPN